MHVLELELDTEEFGIIINNKSIYRNNSLSNFMTSTKLILTSFIADGSNGTNDNHNVGIRRSLLWHELSRILSSESGVSFSGYTSWVSPIHLSLPV